MTLTFENVSLQFCIQQAYGAKAYQVTGPGWIKSERYDITATLPAGTASHEVWPALQMLLIERFQLALRREKKEVPIYAMRIAENGPKMHEGKGGGPEGLRFQPGSIHRNLGSEISGKLQMSNASVEEFCDGLARKTNRPVVDQTGLGGKFEFDFRYYGSSFSAISAALTKQLGLRLEVKKGDVEMLVVENAQRKIARAR